MGDGYTVFVLHAKFNSAMHFICFQNNNGDKKGPPELAMLVHQTGKL